MRVCGRNGWKAAVALVSLLPMNAQALNLAVWTALALAGSTALASPQSRLVSIKEAKSLAYEALPPMGKKLPGIDFDVARFPREPRYLTVTVLWNNPSPGSGVADSFVVDRITGDVWTTAACFEKSNPSLRKLQSQLRRELRLSASDYSRVKGHGPFCD